MERPFITLENIVKNYGPERALGPLSLTVERGETVGIVGENGAGKSTLLRIIAGVEKPSAGRAELPSLAAGEIGYVPQELALYTSLSGMRNLRYWATAVGLFGKRRRVRCKYLLDAVGLADKAYKPVSTYSGGMKRRLNLACALVGEVKLLILDEPTVGADVHSVELILDTVRRFKANGCTVLLVSHHMDEINALCDRTIELIGGTTAQ